MKNKIWYTDPQGHDFPAAADYLSLLYRQEIATEIVQRLSTTTTITKKAKDILRASGLNLLPADNYHVKENIQKSKKGKKLSPILTVRDGKLIIADGYHRLCSIYYLSEDLEVPCRITDKETHD
jgi:hypothetical protein